MINYLIFLALHFVFCALFFLTVQKISFIYYNRKSNPSGKLTKQDVKDIYSQGYKSDFIAASYLTAFPWLVLWVGSYIKGFNPLTAMIATDAVVATIISLVYISDTALYPFWKFKLDSSVFAYLKSLKGAFASVSVLYIVAGFVAVFTVIALVFAVFYGFMQISGIASVETVRGAWPIVGDTGFFILLGGLMFACIRGIGHRPNTPCMVYYSRNMYLNHSALNPLYNLVYSFSINDKIDGQFRFFDNDMVNAEVEKMFPTKGVTQTHLLNTDRPNILFIVWESLCAHYIEVLGGKPGITENFNRLSKEGVLFTKVDAGSFRTDRGLVCLLSGYLGQPTTSVMRNTKKLPGLPGLPRRLKQEGYSTAVVHGGDLKIMHKIDYYITSGHDVITSRLDFEGKDVPACRWGVHDNYMFDWLYDYIENNRSITEPWFITFQTLSSHEPYKVPFNKLPHNISNAYAFTDDAFGKFIDRMKQTKTWENLLVVVVGDHGLNCTDEPLVHSKYPHIPILLLGGAVKEPKVIDTLMGQTDLAATILGQLGLSHEEFTFSRDIFADTYTYPFSMHSYNNGFVYRDATGVTTYDNDAQAVLEYPDDEREKKGKMILQYLYSDLSKR